MDTEQFTEFLATKKYADQVQADLEAGTQVGITGTPALFINGRPMSGAVSYEEITDILDEELAKSQ